MNNPIEFSQGDTAVLTLTATDGTGNPIDLTGATFSTQIKGLGADIAVFPNSQHMANADQVNFRGVFTLTLSSDDTESCNIGIDKQILTTIQIGGSLVIYRGVAILTVHPPVPTQ